MGAEKDAEADSGEDDQGEGNARADLEAGEAAGEGAEIAGGPLRPRPARNDEGKGAAGRGNKKSARGSRDMARPGERTAAAGGGRQPSWAGDRDIEGDGEVGTGVTPEVDGDFPVAPLRQEGPA